MPFDFLSFSFCLRPTSLPDLLCGWVPQWRDVGLPAPETTFWKGSRLTEASVRLQMRAYILQESMPMP